MTSAALPLGPKHTLHDTGKLGATIVFGILAVKSAAAFDCRGPLSVTSRIPKTLTAAERGQVEVQLPASICQQGQLHLVST